MAAKILQVEEKM